MTDRYGPPVMDRSPLATAVVSLSTVVVFFGFLVAVSYPLVTAAAVGGAVLALSARRAAATARERYLAGILDRTTDRPPRTGSHSRHS